MKKFGFVPEGKSARQGKRSFRPVLLASILLAAATVFAPAAGWAEGTLAKIKADGVLKAGLAVDPPFTLRSADGQWYSLMPALLDLLAKDMGVKLEIVPAGWPTIVAGLQAGQFDMIGASISASEERKKAIDFTIPYAYGGTSYLVLADNPKGLKTLEDLNRSDVTIAFATGTIQDTATRKVAPNATVRALPSISYPDLVSELTAKRADAISVPSFLDPALLQKFPDFKPIPEDLKGIEPAGVAWGVNKDDQDFRDYLDKFLQKEIDNGTMKKLMEENLTVQNTTG
jgi:ABC-type amino acid transport substrate-binding protein